MITTSHFLPKINQSISNSKPKFESSKVWYTNKVYVMYLFVMYHTKLFMQVAAVQVVMEQIIYDKIYTCRCIVEDYHQYTIKLIH